MVEIIQIDEKTWRLEDGFVRFFLLEGEEKAALIDSGVNCPNALDIAQSLTNKPIIPINTHGDGDHTSGTNSFTEICIHPDDYVGCNMQNKYPATSMKPLKDGDIVDLGGRPLKIIHIPGHTRGSVAILDTLKRALYSGDSVQKGHIYMFGKHRCPEQFEESLTKLIALKDEYDCIYASHDEYMVSNDYAEKVRNAWVKVRNGEVPCEVIDLYGNKVKSYTTPDCGFYTE
ncbi:MAG: MBL fold metallo-hydrolase [Lachnospiraceae bacterium]|nr:MBL fold metallo-hydrolase [Lachnospiraceae bacterium]